MVLASPIAIVGGVAATVTGGGGAINTSSESNLEVGEDQQQRTTPRQFMPTQLPQQQRNPDLRRQVEYHERGKRMCRRCQSYKPPRAHHCSICKRCIIKMDHHCPWINNCVGIGNHKVCFIYIIMICVYGKSLCRDCGSVCGGQMHFIYIHFTQPLFHCMHRHILP